MKTFLFSLVSTITLSSTLFGQFNDSTLNLKMKRLVKNNEYSWQYKNVFLDYKIGIASEFFSTPKTTYSYLLKNYPNDTVYYPLTEIDAAFMMSIFNFTLEPRINLVSRKNKSVFIKAPINIGLSIYGVKESSTINKTKGNFNLTLPLMLGFGNGLNSTFSSTSNNGFSISAGYQLLLTPLIGADFISFTNTGSGQITPIGEPYKLKRNWAMPLVQIDYYRYTRKDKIRGFSFAFCPVGNVYFKAAMNFVGTKK